MTPSPTRGRFSRAMAAVVSAAVFASSLAPGTAALAADTSLVRATEAPAPQGGASGAVHAPSGFSVPVLAPLSAPLAAPTIAPELGGHAAPQAAAPAASLVPAASPAIAPALSAAAPARAAKPAGGLRAWLSRARGRDAERSTVSFDGEAMRPADASAINADGTGASARTGLSSGGDRSGPPARPTAAGGGSEVPAPEPVKYIHEGFAGRGVYGALGRVMGWLGFRSVRGVVRDQAVGALPADATTEQIIDQIRREFGLDDVLSLAREQNLDADGPRELWLAHYDALRAANRDAFKSRDSHKYEGALESEKGGWLSEFFRGSYRDLANREYAPGWTGTFQRALEVQKHLVGVFVRFPYHLFDSFVFGYFRQAIAYEFFHRGEDFLALAKDKNLARDVFKASLKARKDRGPNRWETVRANAWVRRADRWALTPVVAPLGNFVVRRLTLAATSAVVLGVLAAFAPALPMSFALTSIPLLGPALIWTLNGLPVLTASVPVVGHFLAPVVSAAAAAISKDLVFGPLLNTFVLSTALTFPSAVSERLQQEREKHPLSSLTAGELARTIVQTAFSARYVKTNLKSFVGMATVGAEIAGIMTYAHQADAVVDPGFQARHHAGFFEMIGASVERSKDESPLHVNGAITWGNVLLAKAQQATHLPISDAAMHGTLAVKSLLGFEGASDLRHGTSAAALVHAASSRPGGLPPFDAGLWRLSPAQAAARIAELVKVRGGLDAETASVRDQMRRVRDDIAGKEVEIARLQKESRPASPADRAREKALLAKLEAQRREAYVKSKLAERGDWNGPKDGDTVRRLRRLQQEYYPKLPPPPKDKSGYWDELAAREASYKALSSRLQDYAKGGGPPSGLPLDPETRRRITDLVREIEQQRRTVAAEVAERDTTQNVLASLNQVRNHLLKERRNGEDWKKFHIDVAKNAAAIDLSLAHRELVAALSVLGSMMSQLEAKRGKALASQQQSRQNQQTVAADQAQVDQWRTDATNTVAGDQSSQKDLASQEATASLAATNVTNAQQRLSALIARINAADGFNAGGNAAAQYQANLNKIAQVRQWRLNGNPNDPSAFSVAGFQAQLKTVNDNLDAATKGRAQIDSTLPGSGFAGILIVRVGAVPGQGNVNTPSPAAMLDLLNNPKTGRRAYWQSQLASYQSDLDQVNKLADPNNVIVDEFGLGHSYNGSLGNMAATHPGDPASASKADAVADLKRLDEIATDLNAASGGKIPMLSGLSLTDLQAAIKTYGDALKAAKFPTPATAKTQQAQMELIEAAALVPAAARAIINWSVDQATVDTFKSAQKPGGALDVARTGLAQIVGMMNAMIADVDADVALVGRHKDNSKFTNQEDADLIARKKALLDQQVIPALTYAQKTMLPGLIAYEQASADDMTPSGQYNTLFSSEQTLLSQTNDLYAKTLPWSLATFGGSVGDAAGSKTSIDGWRATLEKYLSPNGYIDSNGVKQESIPQYQQDMADRRCSSGCTRRETLYGEDQPYSLPMKIAQYSAEQAQRADTLNTQDAEINKIVGDLQAKLAQVPQLAGKYDLRGYQLPTGLGTDAASASKVQGLVDGNTVQNLGQQLSAMADDAKKLAGSLNTDVGSATQIPVGSQPTPKATDVQEIEMLSLEAARRMVPSTNPQSAPQSYALARYLYSKAVVDAAKTGQDQVAQATTFLQQASTVLSAAVAQSAPNGPDYRFVDSGGAGESADAVYARKVALFQQLDGFLRQGISFYGLKTTWDQGTSGTIDQMQTYFNALNTIYSNGVTVTNGEISEVDAMESVLRGYMSSLSQTQQKVDSWLSQLNSPDGSALKRIMTDVVAMQDKTLAVLQSNASWHDFDKKLKDSRETISAGLARIDEKQNELAKLLQDPDVQGALDPALVRQIEALRIGGHAWSMNDQSSRAQALVVKKSEFAAFVDTMLSVVTQGSQQIAHQDIASLKADLLQNPQALGSFLPGAGIMDFGDGADGFYLIYQSKLSVPHGLETGSSVTLGNVAKVWGNNISLSGYSFTSPPSSDGSNAPYGDKGIEVQVESLQNRNSVNYLNLDIHRFALDVPNDASIAQNLGESRLMIFDDYAMMLMGDRLYVGLAGYGDAALKDVSTRGDMDQSPRYYGGSARTSLKLTEVMKLNASQQAAFARDPRSFFERVDLNFTGYDPTLPSGTIYAHGADMSYYRTEVGPSFDINRLLHPDGGGDTFTVDLDWARTRGSEDYSQDAGSAAVLKGFSIKNDGGKTWLRIENRASAELGRKVNTYGDRLSFRLPDQGITLSGDGQLIGSHAVRYAQLAKATGDTGSVSVAYGTEYAGQNDRLSLNWNTTFTLAQLWQQVADDSAKNLHGGETLETFNKDLSQFETRTGGDPRAVAELKKVYETDVARKLISQDVGTLTRDIQDLRKAGAFLDNTRVRGMIGFTSNAVSNDIAERVFAGGPTASTYSEIKVHKTQKELIDTKVASLYREGLRLQDRLLEATRDWQSAVVAVAQARWDAKLAAFEADHAPSEPLRREAEARAAAAALELHKALIRYDALTGRPETDTSAFADLSAQDLQELMRSIQKTIAAPDGLEQVLKGLDESELKDKVGKDPFNIVDWLPWVEQLTAGIGVQYQDMMNDQALTAGAGVRLPIWDPTAKDQKTAYVLEAQATRQEIAGVYQQRRLLAAGERERARAWRASASEIEPRGPETAAKLADAIGAYRNGQLPPEDLRRAFDVWRWYARNSAETQSQAALAEAQAAMDEPMIPKAPLNEGRARIESVSDAMDLAIKNSRDLAEVAVRADAAQKMADASNHRVQKMWLDLNVGAGVTARGLGWFPSLGVTAIPVTPVLGFELKPEELRALQSDQHGAEKEYYEALKASLRSGLAVQFYEQIIAYDAARDRVKLYDETVLPELAQAARAGGEEAVRRLDEAKLAREQASLAEGQARATLNLLMGRAADAELDVAMSREQALDALSKFLKGNTENLAVARKQIQEKRVEAARKTESVLAEMTEHPDEKLSKTPAEIQRAVLQARADMAVDHEKIVDKTLRVSVLQVEPVSIVMRSVTNLLGAFADSANPDQEAVAAARLQVLREERALESYDGRRAHDVATLRERLRAARVESEALKGNADPKDRLKNLARQDELQAAIQMAQAGLIALGETPDAAGPAGPVQTPASWSEVKRRLASAEEALSPRPDTSLPDLSPAPKERNGSGAFWRYDFARLTLGHEPIDKNYSEGWVELRLRSPNTRPEVLFALAKLRDQKADRIYRSQLAGADVDAGVLASRFENDVRLRRWIARHDSPDAAPFKREVELRLDEEYGRMRALLGLVPSRDRLIAMVPEDGGASKDLPELAAKLVDDIRSRQIGLIRETLFENGLPSGFGSEDSLMGQIKADTLAERMSYKGFTPVAAAGIFRGQSVMSGFMEAPDPRAIERGLENVMSDVLRKELESDGHMKDLALHLNELMVRVQDGERQLEAERLRIEAAEGELKSRAALSPNDVRQYEAAQARLVAAWSDFGRTMVDTKSAFIALVSELEALNEGPAGTLRPAQAPLRYEVRTPRVSVDDALLDFWADRLLDPKFEAQQDGLLAKIGGDAAAPARERIRAAAAVYRQARADAQAVRDEDFTAREKLELLKKNDVEGKRQALRAAIKGAAPALGGTDPQAPAAAEIVAFFRAEADKAAQAGETDRVAQRRVAEQLRRAFWSAGAPSPELDATFARLETSAEKLDDAKQALLADYLASSGGDPRKFVLTDMALDEYLRAQSAFDAELAKDLESPALKSRPGLAALLDGLYDVRASLDRSMDRAVRGRGMAALDAMIMLEESRLRSARWSSRAPEEIDRIAEALQDLRGLRERWTASGSDLEPVYALTRVDPATGNHVWTVDSWLTESEVRSRMKHGVEPQEGDVYQRDGRTFLFKYDSSDRETDLSKKRHIEYELVGGMDVARAVRDGADVDLNSAGLAGKIADQMGKGDFVAVGGADLQTETFDRAFKGPDSLYGRGKLFFFEAPGAEWLAAKAHDFGFARDARGRIVAHYATADEFAAAKRRLDAAAGDEALANKTADDLWKAAESGKGSDAEEARKADEELGRDQAALKALEQQTPAPGDQVKVLEAKVAHDELVLEAARKKIETPEISAAARAAVDAEETAFQARTWTLYRAGDLRIETDPLGAVRHVRASPARAASDPEKGPVVIDEDTTDEPHRALNPIEALRRSPNEVVIQAYQGADAAPSRDRFPTLQSLRDSELKDSFKTLAVTKTGAAALAGRASEFAAADRSRGWIEVKLNSFGFARDASGRMVELYTSKDDFEAQWKAFDHAERDLADARKELKAAEVARAAVKVKLDKAQQIFDEAVAKRQTARLRFESDHSDARGAAAAEKVRVAGLDDAAESAKLMEAARREKKEEDRLPEEKAFQRAKDAREKAVNEYQKADVKAVNAVQAVKEAEAVKAHAQDWTLYRTGDLDLDLDAKGRVVGAAAAAARGSAALRWTANGGAAAARHLTGALLAAVVDENGALVDQYSDDSKVDAAAAGWKLISYKPGRDVDARVGENGSEKVMTKVRFSHYEENGKPVLLSSRYLLSRLDESRSLLGAANRYHSPLMPYNWGKIALEIPREIAQTPAEFAGRNLAASHYLGRAAAYKVEGGEAEHHGFFREALGWVDVLDLLPDPVTRFDDPSQMPDRVSLKKAIKPDEILGQRSAVDERANGDTYDVIFGATFMTDQARRAAEDLDAARERTLARFNGGVEETMVETLRGRAGKYWDATRRVRSGDPSKYLDDHPDLSSGESRETVTPGALDVDAAERRVTVYEGAEGDDRQAGAMQGFRPRTGKEVKDDRSRIDAARAKAAEDFGRASVSRARADAEETRLWNDWHRLAERLGMQDALQRRIAALRAAVAEDQEALAGWRRYERLLDDARGGWVPPIPTPTTPDPMFWAWILSLLSLASLLAALWYAWRDGLAVSFLK